MINPITLSTQGLTFAYPGYPPALQGVDLTLPPGSFTALIGQNGSGKTTLAQHFNGLLRPDQGTVAFDGQDIGGRSIGDLARTVGYAFQNPDHQIFQPTVGEEIAYGPRNLGLQADQVQTRTEQALNLFQLEEHAQTRPAMLSYGLRRLISLASVYAMGSPVLILDEPTTGLDWGAAQRVMSVFAGLQQQGHTLVVITHDMELVAGWTEACILLEGGRVLLQGSTRSVLTDTRTLGQVGIEPPPLLRLAQQLTPVSLADQRLSVEALCQAILAQLPDKDGQRP